MNTGKKTSPLRTARFAKAEPAEDLRAINASIDTDQRLYRQDIEASKAHAQMLAETGIISEADAQAIEAGLEAIEDEIAAGRFVFSQHLEDIHMNIEHALHERIGEPALKLHTARSRNDQVACDLRLWMRSSCDRLDEAIEEIQRVLIDKSSEHSESLMPGLTHLQTAQPITFGHHLMAYVEMFGRDRGRIRDARSRINESPLGAAALAGTAFPIDRRQTAERLGFDSVMANALDAVSARDFVLEYLAALSILALHLSRLGEELILWSSGRFGYISLDDQWTTGSSIMPQKKNPDAAELVRAHSGRLLGAFVQMAMVMKALPLAYAKDMQEDKKPVFDSFDTMQLALRVTARMIETVTVHTDRMEQALATGHSTATDLADWLVREGRLPFREAYQCAAEIVECAEKKSVPVSELSLEEMQALTPVITEAVYTVLSPKASIHSRDSDGGTAPVRLRQAIERARALWLGDGPKTQRGQKTRRGQKTQQGQKTRRGQKTQRDRR